MKKISIKLPNPIRETLVSKLVFMTIPCLKFWALGVLYLCAQLAVLHTYNCLPGVG